MQSTPRFTISRHLIILMPRQPALDWIKQADPNSPDVSLDEVRQEQNAYLVPETVEGQEEAERWVQRRWSMFFENFLADWYMEASWWPQKRTPEMFKKWFEVQYHSMVWDMAAGEPIDYEDWDELDDEA